MTAYQAGHAKFDEADTAMFGVSTDNSPSQKVFADQLKLTFPLLSDFADRKVATDYGVLIPNRGMAYRVTFVIDKDGKIDYIEKDKLDPDGSSAACSRLAHKKAS
jgi:peroxiredoxin